MSRIIVSINKLHIYIIPEAFFEKKIIQEVKDLGLTEVIGYTYVRRLAAGKMMCWPIVFHILSYFSD
ncbi:hypothetical protein SETIT_3G377200v2 [Setaria italica]|uniref:Uncharacterized protein n=1 Tax=Setaria italica TaxID=4555 RepID=A0A368QN01_SETIT|nr:hypothetical protein SETIT_3G377200v2 [Setaria italica]